MRFAPMLVTGERTLLRWLRSEAAGGDFKDSHAMTAAFEQLVAVFLADMGATHAGKNAELMAEGRALGTAVLELAECPNASVTLLGGDVHAGKNYIETLDPDISHVLRSFYFDKVFITVDGIDLERGYTVNNKNQIGLYTQLARMTRRFYILADSAKYDRRAFASVFPPEKTCRMITTSGAPQKYLDFYARQGIPCTVLPFE